MKLEKRYYVAKLSDLKELTPEDLKTFNEICTKIEIGRGINGKKPFDAIVIENDWPEYDKVLEMLTSRIVREETDRKFEKMLDNKERLGYFFVVETHQGTFLITSDAHSTNRLTKYRGYKYRALFSPDCGFDKSEILTTSWSVYFKHAVMVSLDEIIALYDPNEAISNYNIAEFINDKLRDAKTI